MLVCLSTVIINLTALQINSVDIKNLSRAMDVCKQKELCLKSFQKRDKQVYRAICGEKENFDRKGFDNAEINGILLEMGDVSIEEKKRKLRNIGVEVK